MEKWSAGLMVRRKRNDKIENGSYPLKYPLFHHSMIEVKNQPSKIPYIFIELYKFRDAQLNSDLINSGR